MFLWNNFMWCRQFSLKLLFRDILRMICHSDFKCGTMNFDKQRKQPTKYLLQVIALSINSCRGSHLKGRVFLRHLISYKKLLKVLINSCKNIFKNSENSRSANENKYWNERFCIHFSKISVPDRFHTIFWNVKPNHV